MFVISESVDPNVGLTFVDMAKSLPQSGVHEICSNEISCGLTRKHLTRLEKFAMDKHSSLLQKCVNYGGKKFSNIDPLVIKLFCP
jgi:hypothetical protein